MNVRNKLECLQWVDPTYLTSVFSLPTSVLSLPDGTTIMAFADVNTDVSGC
jgi:hypothetical protein